MVGIGSLLAVLALVAGVWWKRHHDLPSHRAFLAATVLSGPAAIVALECGWIVTEVGRQPWVVYGYLRTSQAATTATAVPISLTVVIVAYFLIGAATIAVLVGMARRWRRGEIGDHDVPYGPTRRPGTGGGEDVSAPARHREPVRT